MINNFPDNKLFIMLKQSYNFDSDIISILSKEALFRNIITKTDLNKLLSKNEKIRLEKRLKRTKSDNLIKSLKPSLFSKLKKRILFLKGNQIGINFEDDATYNYDLSRKRRFKKKYNL